MKGEPPVISSRPAEVIAHLAPVVARLAYTISPVTPNPSGLPGSQTAQNWTGGLLFDGLLCSAIVIVLGALAYGFGKLSSNYGASKIGLAGVGGGVLLAVLTGGAFGIVNFFYTTGHSIH
jgi:hypothetical protein